MDSERMTHEPGRAATCFSSSGYAEADGRQAEAGGVPVEIIADRHTHDDRLAISSLGMFEADHAAERQARQEAMLSRH